MVAQRSSGRHGMFLNEIRSVDVNNEDLTITMSVYSFGYEVTIDLSDVAHVPFARQAFPRLVEWATTPQASYQTVKQAAIYLRQLIRELRDRRVTDASDLTPDLVEDLCDNFVHDTYSALLKAALHQAGQTMSQFSYALRYRPAARSEDRGYDDEQIRMLRTSAEAHINAMLERHKTLVRQFTDGNGDPWFKVTDDECWSVPAAQIIEAAEARDERRPDAEKVAGSRSCKRHFDEEQIIDWLLLHPGRLVQTNGRTDIMRDWSHAIYPSRTDLGMLGILFTLANNEGRNPAVFMAYGTDHIVHLGGDFAVIRDAKARQHLRSLNGVSTEHHLRSIGGLCDTAAVLTRFTRHHHEHVLSTSDDVTNDVAASLFFTSRSTNHRPDIRPTEGLGSDLGSQIDGWVEAGHGERVLFNAIRLWAVAQSATNPSITVVGQSPATRDGVYMPRSRPLPAVAEAASDVLSGVINATRGVLSDCATQVTHPVTQLPCRLGPTACLSCESGRRTEDHLPALHEARALSQHLLSISAKPDLADELAVLADLCDQAIGSFTEHDCTNGDCTVDLSTPTPLRAVIASHLLTEHPHPHDEGDRS